MRKSLVLALFLLLALPPLPAAASNEDAEDWKLIGGALALVQQIVHLAAQSPDPQAAQKEMNTILSGESTEANRIASGLVNEILLDVPQEYRGAFLSIGKDLLVLARREQAKAQELPSAASPEAALQARKELHAMGLRYWDEQQFLDAVRRGDRIAVDLFAAARGLEAGNLSATNPPPAR